MKTTKITLRTQIENFCGSYQLGLGHPILRDVSLQISRQLHGHLTYFFPEGGFLIGYTIRKRNHIHVDSQKTTTKNLTMIKTEQQK